MSFSWLARIMCGSGPMKNGESVEGTVKETKMWPLHLNINCQKKYALGTRH